MSDAGDNGGPASEKTLLDEFAGQALPKVIEDYCRSTQGIPDGGGIALTSYAIATAMIAEKRKRETTT